MNLLQNKHILITGGTSRLGRAFTSKAIQQGASLYLTYHRNQEEAASLVSQGAQSFPLDLGHSQAILDFAKDFKSRKIPLDILIHNAALVRDHTISNLSEQDWDEVMTVNLKAPYLLTKELLPLLMKKNKNQERSPKKIFFLTSRTAVRGGFGVSNYSAAKAGLLGLMKSLAQELGSRKILVNAVNPGFMKSPMTKSMPREAVEANLVASPLHQYSDPEEVANFLIYLCSDQVQGITGQTFHFESRGMI